MPFRYPFGFPGRPTFRCASLLAAASALLAACAVKPPPALPDPHQRSVQIQRTAYGVAHIQAADFEALAYGVAYAHAEDNVCQTADRLVTVRGERSRFFGAEATALLGLRALPNEQIDIYVRGLMDDGELALAESRVSEEAKAMARGYVAGYNRFLKDREADPRKPLPAACAGQPWLRPMTLADYRRLNELVATQAGSVAWADAVVAARLPSPGAPQPRPVGVAEAAQVLAAYRPEGAGSNAWAFGAETSLNGRGLLVANPHFPWRGVNRFWQMHLTIPGQLDVMGAAIGHSPLVQSGFNQDLAWTHTVSTGKRFTLHELKLLPDDPARYLVSGQPERMRARTVSYEVRRADGTLETRLHTVWMTRYGPVVALPRAGLNWTPQTAYALQDANTWNLRTTDTWLALNRATNIAEVQGALRQQGVPWVNTVAADRQGDVLYADASAVPDVDAAQLQRCAPSKAAAALLGASGLVVLDGSRSDCQWRRDPAAPVPGLIPLARMPTLERRDWVQNANDSYWLSNPLLALDGVSPMVGAVGVPQGLRTRAGIEQILDRLAGRDGLAAHAKVGPGEAQAMLLSNRNQAATMVLDDLLAACDGRNAPSVVASLAVPAAAAVKAPPPAAAVAKTAPSKPAAAKPAPSRERDKARAPTQAKAAAPKAKSNPKAAAGAASPAFATASAPPAPPPPRPAAAAPPAPVALGTAGREACSVLAAWDRRDELGSRGALLFRTWWRVARETPGLWRTAFNAADPVRTPTGLNTGDVAVRNRLFEALEQAVATLRTAGFALDVPLGEVQHRQTPGGRVALHGGTEAEGVLNKVEATGTGPLSADGVEVGSGSSYLQTVAFDERGPVAQGLLTYGQSSQPDSPFSFDQLPLFSRKEWPTLPFRAEDVAKARVGPVTTLVLEARPVAVAASGPAALEPPASAPATSPPPAPVPGSRNR